MKKLDSKTMKKLVGASRFVAVAGILVLVSACAPPTTGLAPSPALRQQLDDIRQQQQVQARQLQQLQQQLAQFQQQRDGLAPVDMQPPAGDSHKTDTESLAEVPQAPESFQIPADTAVEIQTVAASASTYLAAFSDLASGRWAVAEAGFQTFLNNFGDHQYAPNARYWLASAQLSQGKTEAAMANLRQIVVDPRGRAKAPAALLQLERLYRRQGQALQADEIAEQIRSRFPDSPEAQQIYRGSEQEN